MQVFQNPQVVKFSALVKQIFKGIKKNLVKTLIKAIITSIVMMVLNVIVQGIDTSPGTYLDHLKTSSWSWAAFTGIFFGLVTTIQTDGMGQLLHTVKPAFNNMMNFSKNDHKIPFIVGVAAALMITLISQDPAMCLSFSAVGFLSTGARSKSKLLIFISSMFSSIIQLFSKSNAFVIVSSLLAGSTLGFFLHGLITGTGIFMSGAIVMVFLIYNLLKNKKSGGDKNE